jgi:hypothetical protein
MNDDLKNLEVRTGRADHAVIYVQGTNHAVAMGLKVADAEQIVRMLREHAEMLETLKHAAAVYGELRPANGASMQTLVAYERIQATIKTVAKVPA